MSTPKTVDGRLKGFRELAEYLHFMADKQRELAKEFDVQAQIIEDRARALTKAIKTTSKSRVATQAEVRAAMRPPRVPRDKR